VSGLEARVTARPATPADAFDLMRLYQECGAARTDRDPVLLDHAWLSDLLASPAGSWYLAEQDGRPSGMVAFLVDRDQALAKISRMHVRAGAPGERDQDTRATRAMLEFAIQDMRASRAGADVVYTTTRSLTLSQQSLTLDLGFRILGIFPNAAGADELRLNGLTAWFADGVLERMRIAPASLHPAVLPFYEIVRRQCALPPLPAAPLPSGARGAGRRPEAASGPVGPASGPCDAPLPQLELIEAPAFVRHRFHRLSELRSLTLTFYPFAEPNALVTDPEQTVEVFIRVIPDMRFATILAERIDRPLSPVSMYRRIAEMLKSRHVTYVEVINDAADIAGIECIIQAGYLPCAYFPCLKKLGDSRRDFVVFGRTFELPELATTDVDPVYVEFFHEHQRLLRASCVPRRRPGEGP
jgi:hypothetical protein